MKVRNKKHGHLGNSTNFNVHGLSEIIVYFDDDSCDSEFIHDYDVYIESTGEWMDMCEAFRMSLVIPDNYNTWFKEPDNETEKERGWF